VLILGLEAFTFFYGILSANFADFTASRFADHLKISKRRLLSLGPDEHSV